MFFRSWLHASGLSFNVIHFSHVLSPIRQKNWWWNWTNICIYPYITFIVPLLCKNNLLFHYIVYCVFWNTVINHKITVKDGKSIRKLEEHVMLKGKTLIYSLFPSPQLPEKMGNSFIIYIIICIYIYICLYIIIYIILQIFAHNVQKTVIWLNYRKRHKGKHNFTGTVLIWFILTKNFQSISTTHNLSFTHFHFGPMLGFFGECISK